MFKECSSLIDINLTNFDTSNVTDMKFMFSECIFLKELNIMNFNFESLNDMSYMFNKCYDLISLDIPQINNDIDVDHMFSECSKQLKAQMRQKNLNKNAFKDMRDDKPVKPDYEDKFEDELFHI